MFCTNCGEFYCQNCAENHVLYKAMRNHKVKPVEEICVSEIASVIASFKESASSAFCDQHKGQLINFYCHECKVPICTACCLLKHKNHKYSELSDVAHEAHEKLRKMAASTDEYVQNVDGLIAKLEATEDHIHADFCKARQDVHDTAKNMHGLIDAREKVLLGELATQEEEAVTKVNSAKKEAEIQKANALSFNTYIGGLCQTGEPIDKAVHLPGIEEQLSQQVAAPLQTVTWTSSFTKGASNEAALQAMLGNSAMHCSAPGMSLSAEGEDEKITLGKPILTLPLSDSSQVTGIAAIGDILCVIHWGGQCLLLHDMKAETSKTHTISGLKQARGMALLKSEEQMLVLTDDTGKLFFVKVLPGLDVIVERETDIPLKSVRCVSVAANTGDLLIGSLSPDFLVCDAQGELKSKITLPGGNGFARSVTAVGNGYAAIDCSTPGSIQWLDCQGKLKLMHTYGKRSEEGLSLPKHMVSDSRGRLIVADRNNHRVHLVGSNKQFCQYLLTQEDGLTNPNCVLLNEVSGHLFLGHHQSSGLTEIRVYKWPIASASSRAPHIAENHYKLDVKLGQF